MRSFSRAGSLCSLGVRCHSYLKTLLGNFLKPFRDNFLKIFSGNLLETVKHILSPICSALSCCGCVALCRRPPSCCFISFDF